MRSIFQFLDRWLFRYMTSAGLVLQCSSAPDMTAMNEAAKSSAELGDRALTWYQQQYKDSAPQRDAAIKQASDVSDAQLQGMQYATQQAKDLDARNKTVFQPLEDKIVADASTYDTPERRLGAANQATAGVETAFGNAQDGLNRSLARSGVTPGSGRSMTLMQDAALAKAKAISGATTAAEQNVESQGHARELDAAGLGKGIVSNQATMQNIAQTGGAQAVGASTAAVNAANSGNSTMSAGFGSALQGQQQAGSLYGQVANIEQQSNNSNNGLFGALGGAAGTYFGLNSDENVKSDTGEPADPEAMLDGVNRTPIDSNWRYDPAKGGPADGGAAHDGPMAQQVRKHMGEKAAPGGKVIDLATMNAHLMGSVQALSKKVDKLEGGMARVVNMKKQKVAA